MTETTEISTTMVTPPPSPQQQQQPKNPIFPFFPNFNFNFNFQLPHFLFPPKHDATSHTNKPNLHDDDGKGPNLVTFPNTQQQLIVPPPLQAEPDATHNSTAKTSTPIILYQVYALGAFFISRWAWAKWNERKGQGKSPNDDGTGSQDNE